ncbi:MAG: hypothetical protein ABIG44_12870, partial [Planctomycetota bacterium]
NDIVVYVELSTWRPMIETGVMAASTYMQMGMAMSGQADEAVLNMWKWFFDELNRFIRDVNVVVIGGSAQARGVTFEATTILRPDSPVAKYCGKIGRTKHDLLRGVLDENSTIVVGGEWERPPDTHSLNARLMEVMVSTTALKEKLGEEILAKGLRSMTASYDLMTGSATSITLAPGEVSMKGSGVYFTKEPRVVIEGIRHACELSPEFFNSFGAGSTVEFKVRDERVNDVPVSAFDISYTTVDEKTRRMLEKMYGQNMAINMASHAEGVAFTMGPRDVSLAQMRSLLEGDGPKLADNPRLIAARKTISPHPQLWILLDLPGIFTFGVDMFRSTGLPVPPIEFAGKDTPLVSFGGYLESERCRVELFVPAPAVQAIVAGFQSLSATDEDY